MLPNAAVCGRSIATVFSLFPSDLVTLSLALTNVCTKVCGEMYANFLEIFCNDKFTANSLRVSCTPTHGSAAMGDYCRFALADILDISVLDALFSCYNFTMEVLCVEDCRAALLDLKTQVGCCYQSIYNNTLYFSHLYEAGFITLDEYNAVHDLNNPAHNPWVLCDIKPPKRCDIPFKH